uniref:Miraculin n=1 Tax=Noccaea caerulescens TaxID=107243 RepID=A0A1J3GGB2_NOCCA
MSSLLYIFLLFAAFISHSGAATEPAVEAVKDIYGKPLLAGISYYVLPVVRGGGGLTVILSENTTCPRTVVQDQSEASQGIPVEFSPSVKSRTIPVSTDLNFQFSAFTIWKLDNFDTDQYFVSTCGVGGNPGRETVSNWFKIDKFEGNYKIRFCPSVCDVCRVMCRDIGVFVKDGKRRLALSDVPLKVKFKKA